MILSQSGTPDALDITSLVECAVLAPSSHNTQPWRFSIGDKSVSLYADRTRALPINDPDDRELTISCGCALMNLRVAAARAGLFAGLDTLPEPGDADLLAVVHVNSEREPVQAGAELFSAIFNRRTYRKHFESRAVSESVLQELSSAANREGVSLHLTRSKYERSEISKLISEGDRVQWKNPAWRRELAAWMHPGKTGDGLAVPSLIAPVFKGVVRTFDMGRSVGAKDKQLAEEAPVLAVLETENDQAIDWLSAGQALERLLLTACQRGLQASYLNQPIQVPSLRQTLQELFGNRRFQQILLRIGFPSGEVPAVPRRGLADVMF